MLPLPEDLALKHNNNKGFAIFHCKVHVIEVAGSFEREHTVLPRIFQLCLSIRGNKRLPNLTDLFHLNPR